MKKRLKHIARAAIYVIGASQFGWVLYVAHHPAVIAIALGFLAIYIGLLATDFEALEEHENKQ
ncbi:hypothetical protein ABRP95_09725 [Corynebacterium sp. KPL2895]|uniref:hypothetical protein n=1 Tax=Corynebacterium sp. KPL2895 TaxID=3158320 RepID=UPI0032EACA23